MSRKYLLLLSVCFTLLIALVWCPHQGQDAQSVMSPRLQEALDGDGPWVVWVFFRDKDLSGGALESALAEAETQLSPRAARRRAKVNPPEGRLVDEADLAIHPDYLVRTRSTGATSRQTSRWLNAASYQVTRTQAERLSRLECVAGMDLVNRTRRAAVPTPVGNPVPIVPRPGIGKSSASGTVDYGANLDAMLQVDVPPLHDAGLSGEGVLIGMLDTGFRTTHEALENIPVLGTWDFINNDSNVDDIPIGSRNHGTMTLSTVAGNMPGSLVGPAYGASVVLAQTEDISQEVPIEEDFWVAGLEWVESFGADIVSSSLSYFDWYDYSDLDGNTAVTTIAADLAAGRGLLVINSAGNSRTTTGTIGAPADGDSVLTVGAVDINGIVTYFSSPGPTFDGRIKPEVAALGQSNTVTDPNDDHAYLSASGTSFSCPLAAGVVALMLERVPQLTPMQIIEALQQTASQAATPDNDMGWGIVKAYAAATWFGPVIDHQALPDTEDTAGPYVVTTVITDRVGVDPADIWLNYRVNGGGWTTLLLATTGAPDTYTADIPGQAASSLVEYYLEASGTNGFTTMLPYRGSEYAFSFYTGPWRRIDYAATPSASIPDGVGWGTSSVINVPVEESGYMLEVTVDIDITHPDRGELQVLLTGPNGTAVTLHNQSGAGSANLTGTWPTSLTVDGPGDLDDYLDLSNMGDWTLQVIDYVMGNTGILNSWGLHFTLIRYVTPVEDGAAPRVTKLGPNVPNPFNPRTEISFDLLRTGQTRLSIFDVRGMLVRRLLDENLPAGPHTAVWDGKNGSGRAVSSGTYFYRLESGPVVQVRKMLLIR
jgi:subtilisin family serine protease/subtilisin-like proprotein convertase family protein